jgi:hypothetical protein
MGEPAGSRIDSGGCSAPGVTVSQYGRAHDHQHHEPRRVGPDVTVSVLEAFKAPLES